jgi:hypothetical protein
MGFLVGIVSYGMVSPVDCRSPVITQPVRLSGAGVAMQGRSCLITWLADEGYGQWAPCCDLVTSIRAWN